MTWAEDMADLAAAEVEAFGETVTYGSRTSTVTDATGARTPLYDLNIGEVIAHVSAATVDQFGESRTLTREFTVGVAYFEYVTPKRGDEITYGTRTYTIERFELILGDTAYKFTAKFAV